MSLKSRNKVSTEFNMSSLADIIFLLLIFFLITSRIVTPNAISVKRPQSNIKESVTPAARITVDDQLNYYVDGEKVGYNGLRPALTQSLTGVERPRVILDMDKSLSVENLVDLYDLANDLRFELVLATEPKKE